ncbi:MAG: flagellar protein FliT [bacterium]
MTSQKLYVQVKSINNEILASLKEGDIEKTLSKLRERDDCMQAGLIRLESDIVKREEVLPILEEIIKQDNEITNLLNQKIDNLRSDLTAASSARKIRQNYDKKEKNDEPRFLDKKG